MPLDKAKVQAVHDEVRGYFKGQLKSENKIYASDEKSMMALQKIAGDAKLASGSAAGSVLADIKKRETRNSNAESASKQITAQRAFMLPAKDWREANWANYGFFVLDQPELAGNCTEMAAAAAYLVVLRGAGTPWMALIAWPGDHAFCIVTDGLAPNVKTTKGCAIDSSTHWVIDPWANVCCPLQQYCAQFEAKMRQWSARKKYVVVNCQDLHMPIRHDPAGYSYLFGFKECAIHILGVSKDLPKMEALAIKRKRDPQSTLFEPIRAKLS